ncbi:MAG: zinc ribbon domain-containing protein [Thermoplasmata archaeon]|nr:zinc ribbon domain-containing protein [Thermoplasmata archaeon]MCK5396666.1 zinc ribbon domain-containing protein [Thermoplasmata archaeon]
MVESSEDSNLVEKSIPDEATTCPMCGEPVPANAIECPNCEEPFSPEAFEIIESDEKKSKFLFWLGLILVLVGGPGIALGSWLHDLLKVPIATYDNFDSFGWVNQLVSTVGIIILVIGIIMLILSLPKLRPDDEEEETIITGDQGG